MTFDLEKARDAAKFDDHMAITMFPLAIAEIERLRAEISEQKGMIWKTQQVKKEQYAQIKDLKADLEQSERVIEARLEVIDQQAARIKELEADNQNLVTLNKSLMNNDWILRDNNRKYRKRAQKAELLNKELKSKIGPDAKPRSWQITEERKAALWHAIKVLKENDIMEEPEEHLWDEEVTVLQAMLTEAGQE